MNNIKLASKLFKDIIAATFSDYRKRNVFLSVRDNITLSGLNWSGGSRSEYRSCTVDGKALPVQHDMSAPAPWDNPFEGKALQIPFGVAVVRGGHFCGKQATLSINVSAETYGQLVKLLPSSDVKQLAGSVS